MSETQTKPRVESGKPKAEETTARSAAGSFAEHIASLPSPFRPRHLTEAIRLFAAEERFTPEQLAAVDPARFLREHGLPNPLKRFRVTGYRGSVTLEAREYEAVDESAATAQYRAECITEKDPASWNCRVVILDY